MTDAVDVKHQLNGHWEKAAQLWTDLSCPYEAALARLDQPRRPRSGRR